MRNYKILLTGGLYGIEAKKRSGRNWYIHMHILCEGYYIPQAQLSRDWYKITGNSFRVDIRKFNNGIAGLRYITKYMTKPPTVGRQRDLYNRVMFKARLVQTFGSWYKVRSVKDPSVCPLCGCQTWYSEFDLIRFQIQSFPPYKPVSHSPPPALYSKFEDTSALDTLFDK